MNEKKLSNRERQRIKNQRWREFTKILYDIHREYRGPERLNRMQAALKDFVKLPDDVSELI